MSCDCGQQEKGRVQNAEYQSNDTAVGWPTYQGGTILSILLLFAFVGLVAYFVRAGAGYASERVNLPVLSSSPVLSQCPNQLPQSLFDKSVSSFTLPSNVSLI